MGPRSEDWEICLGSNLRCLGCVCRGEHDEQSAAPQRGVINGDLLDAATQRALQLLPSGADAAAAGAAGVAPAPSLFGLLNRCRTGMGSRLLLRWVQQPSLDAAMLNRDTQALTIRLTTLVDAAKHEADMQVSIPKTFSQHVGKRTCHKSGSSSRQCRKARSRAPSPLPSVWYW